MAAEQRLQDNAIAKGRQESLSSSSISAGLQAEISSLQVQLRVRQSYFAAPAVLYAAMLSWALHELSVQMLQLCDPIRLW